MVRVSSFSDGREKYAPEKQSLSSSVEAKSLRRCAGCLLLGDAAAAAAAGGSATFSTAQKRQYLSHDPAEQQRATCQLHNSDKRLQQQPLSAFYCCMGEPSELVWPSTHTWRAWLQHEMVLGRRSLLKCCRFTGKSWGHAESFSPPPWPSLHPGIGILGWDMMILCMHSHSTTGNLCI